MKAAIKLKAGQNGPLEMTFFLKKQMFRGVNQVMNKAGVFIVDIIPKIVMPEEAKYGKIKCYFFQQVQSASCNFNSTMYLYKTRITIYTPRELSFQESEIPIIVTTEGAALNYESGILLDPLVQRYLFHVYMYNDDTIVQLQKEYPAFWQEPT